MSEGVRYCGRCDMPITKQHPGMSTAKNSLSGGGAVVWIHTGRCPAPPPLTRRYPY
ncbi:hypothetical protein ABZY36_10425 [Streptomyces sp. NPDC006627]|uniref:hypothetical protein n=1 Tax=Streptomyces sp. NPDC006627 TaxID=3154679 RepID=UPI0033BC4AD4